jgi:hypothetical protein
MTSQPNLPRKETDSERPAQKSCESPTDEKPRYVGRSRGTIAATREDLLAPVNENWEVGNDL